MSADAELPLPVPSDEVETRLVDDVREHGWHAVHVGAGEHPEPLNGVPFAYTAGMWLTQMHPELVLVGDFPYAQDILESAVQLIQRGGRFLPGAQSEDLIDGEPVRFVAVAQAHHAPLLGYARWLHRGRGFQAVQLLVPDGDGAWPDKDGYAGVAQPSLR